MVNKMTNIRKRRSTGNKLVVLNEEELIHQVHLRPILYDRTLKSYRKASLRQQYWQEVSDGMGATSDECRRRWRSLRDAFSKHYKQIQRTEDEHVRNKHRKWVFYDQMSFMIPYMENANCEIGDHLIEEFGDNSDDDDEVHCAATKLNECLTILPSQETQNIKLSSSMVDDHHEHVQENKVVLASDFMPIQEESVVMEPHHHNSHNMSNQNSDFNRVPINHNDVRTSSEQCAPTNPNIYLDPDERFLLSCAPALRRFTNRQNAYARLEIQKILFEIEFCGRQINN